jgi:hypothetical protein
MLAATAIPLSLNWTDFIKTRMQGAAAPGCTAPPYTGGFLATGSRMAAEEGILAVWSTGMAASLMRECTAFGIRIGAYPTVRDIISSIAKGKSGGEAGVGTKFNAGVVLGAISGLATTPFDLVRIRVQADAGRVDSSGTLTTGLRAGSQQQVRNTPHCFRVIMGEGALALFRGLSVNVVRSICMTVGTMPVYEHTKHLAKAHLGVADTPSLHFGAGIVAGLVGTTATAPADMLRTRVMQSGKEGGVGLLGAASAILREHGPQGFFRGWLPAYMRVGPLFLMMPALVEQVRKHIFGLGYIV